jgi:hypothetical protein
MALALVLGALGCKPSFASKSAGGYAVGYGGDYGYDDYAYAEEATVATGYRVDVDRTVISKESKKFEARQRSQHSPSPTTTLDASTPVEVEEAPPPPEAEPDQVSQHGRQIIYTAGMGLSVFAVDDVMAKLEAIPERHGGWLHQRFDNRVVLRVPAAKLQSIIAEIGEWGVVEWKTLEALDVTAEYTDLDSRIRVLEQMQGHLQALLARAQNVEQALEIQVELTRINAELERLRAQMRLLESSIAFSTLAVELRERSTATVEPGHDPFPWVDQLGAEVTAYR